MSPLTIDLPSLIDVAGLAVGGALVGAATAWAFVGGLHKRGRR